MSGPTDPPSWRASLADVQQRGGAVQLIGLSVDALPTGRQYRVRLLACEAEHIVVAKPRYRRDDPGLKPGQGLAIRGGDDGQWWEGATEVIQSEHYQLNRRKRVSALRLSFPQYVGSAQRRSFYRVEMDDLSLHQAYLSAAAPPIEDVCHVKRSYPARLLNISGGGVSLEAPCSASELLARYDWLWCELTLPTEPAPLMLPCRVVRLQMRPDGTYKIGLKYELPDEPFAHRIVDQVCRFTAWAQRRKLQLRHSQMAG